MAKAPNPIQRLRLGRDTLDELVEQLDREDANYSPEKRDSARRPTNRPAVLIQAMPGEVGTRHEVYVRNVSASGASVLHTAFLQPQLTCTLVLVTSTREPVSVAASVVRCNHISGHMHDVGMRFVRELSEEDAQKLCIIPESQAVTRDPPTEYLRTALARCKDLANEVHELIESGAPPEKVLPLLDELRSLEPAAAKAA
ncbi:MAG: PilZ domain-containing protein [Phycisphaerales bacterium]